MAKGEAKNKKLNRLSDRAIKALAGPKRYHDGGGLWLNVTATGRRSFVFVFTTDNKRQERGLGPYKSKDVPDGITLAQAREKAIDLKRGIRDGITPPKAHQAKVEAPEAPTFGEIALRFIELQEGNWRNAKHAAQWHSTLETYAKSIWGKDIASIGVDDIEALLKPIWIEKAETASRVRGRLESVFSYARTKKIYPHANPATWTGNLSTILPPRKKLQRGHHLAMPYKDVPAFYKSLKLSDSKGAACLRFTILTAVRSGESRLAVWSEFDLDAHLWTIPAKRMKAGKAHEVPLSDEAMAILMAVPETRRRGLVFPGTKEGKPLSDMTLAAFPKRMNLGAVDEDGKFHSFTVHGFRSAFREWATNETTFLFEIGEMALAHEVGNAVTRAYQRGTALETRREMMQQWAAFVSQ